jgi:hypothetical protein
MIDHDLSDVRISVSRHARDRALQTIGLFGDRLSSDAKCNTPRRCHAILFASVGDEGDRIGVLRTAGRSMGPLPGRSVGRNHHLHGAAAERSPLGRIFAASRRAYQLHRRREAILEQEAALRLFVGDRFAEGWTPEQISGWLKSGNEPRLRAIGCETIYAFIYRTAQEAEALVALSDASPQTPSPASRQSLAHQLEGCGTRTIDGAGAQTHVLQPQFAWVIDAAGGRPRSQSPALAGRPASGQQRGHRPSARRERAARHRFHTIQRGKGRRAVRRRQEQNAYSAAVEGLAAETSREFRMTRVEGVRVLFQ